MNLFLRGIERTEDGQNLDVRVVPWSHTDFPRREWSRSSVFHQVCLVAAPPPHCTCVACSGDKNLVRCPPGSIPAQPKGRPTLPPKYALGRSSRSTVFTVSKLMARGSMVFREGGWLGSSCRSKEARSSQEDLGARIPLQQLQLLPPTRPATPPLFSAVAA